MKYLTAFVLSLTSGLIVFADVRVPQRLPEGPEPPLINKMVVEGHYLVTGGNYKSTALIVQPPGSKLYVVYQYSGPNVLKGVGFMDGDRFVIGWEQDKTIGASSIRFLDGKGRASWVSNPGSGQVSHETWSLIGE
jgi:hypothetical protein